MNNKVSATTVLMVSQVSESIGVVPNEIIRKLRRRDTIKRSNANSRGIPFELSFNDHCIMLLHDWLGKPVFQQIGKGKGMLCLMRKNDVGPYSISNCYYGLFSENSREGAERQTYSEETRLKLSKASSRPDRVGVNHPFYNMLPWRFGKAKANHSIWKQLDKIYDWHMENPVKKRSGGKHSMSKVFNVDNRNVAVFSSILKYFSKFPNRSWYESTDYKQWKEDFEVS